MRAWRDKAHQSQAGLRAEFFFDPADDQDFGHLGRYKYCASDQVRFFDAGTGDPVPLAEVASS